MYVEIKDNQLLSWCKNPYLDYEKVDIEYSTFNPEDYTVRDGKLANITNTKPYKDKKAQEQKDTQLVNLKAQIDAIDKQRIRAIAEPEIKDKKSGQTWLDYYTQQIVDLRNQIANL